MRTPATYSPGYPGIEPLSMPATPTRRSPGAPDGRAGDRFPGPRPGAGPRDHRDDGLSLRPGAIHPVPALEPLRTPMLWFGRTATPAFATVFGVTAGFVFLPRYVRGEQRLTSQRLRQRAGSSSSARSPSRSRSGPTWSAVGTHGLLGVGIRSLFRAALLRPGVPPPPGVAAVVESSHDPREPCSPVSPCGRSERSGSSYGRSDLRRQLNSSA